MELNEGNMLSVIFLSKSILMKMDNKRSHTNMTRFKRYQMFALITATENSYGSHNPPGKPLFYCTSFILTNNELLCVCVVRRICIAFVFTLPFEMLLTFSLNGSCQDEFALNYFLFIVWCQRDKLVIDSGHWAHCITTVGQAGRRIVDMSF